MKKKQVALLLAALMCITSVAESAAVMGAEIFFGGRNCRDAGHGGRSRSRGYAEIWTSGEEVSDFGTDERRKWTDLHQKNQRHRQTQQVLNR